MYSLNALSQRTMSAYPVSIGTSLALESLAAGPNPPYDPDRPIPPIVDINNYDEVWVNTMTLYRNIVGALQKDDFAKVLPRDIGDIIGQEASIIEEVLNRLSNNTVKVVFYASDYADLAKVYPHAKVRTDTTPKQIIYTEILIKSIGSFFNEHKLSDKYRHFKLGLTSTPGKRVLLFSSYTIDLLSYKQFKKMDLLESHTGQLKGRNLWYTKYQDGKKLIRIPFNSAMLQIFGDSTSFFAWPKAAREEIIELSERYKWTQTTTPERIKYSITNLKDQYLSSVIKQMF